MANKIVIVVLATVPETHMSFLREAIQLVDFFLLYQIKPFKQASHMPEQTI